MKKLTKQKQTHLILVVLGTVLALAGAWFGLIRNQQAALVTLAQKKAATEKKLGEVINTIKNPKETDATLAEVSAKLGTIEDGMASGDLYSWVVGNIRRFKQSYNVDIPQYSQPVTADMNLLSKFPYKQTTVTVAGTAYYQDLGKFIADFENTFPYCRLLNLEIDPQSSQGTGDGEKVSFRMDIVTLVVPNST